jgi:hypothetical protein
VNKKFFNSSRGILIVIAMIFLVLGINEGSEGNYILYLNIVNLVAIISFMLYGIDEINNKRPKTAILLLILSLMFGIIFVLNL